MDSGNDGGTLGTTAGSDCCCWHDVLAQNHRKRYSLFVKSGDIHSNQSTVDQRTELKKEISAVEQKESAYDEVKHCAETAISLKSNIAYATVKHTSAL